MADRIISVLIGALAFWIPVLLLEGLSKGRYSITIVNVLPVVCAACLYWLLRRGHFGKLKALSLYMLAGIYLLGPLSITIAGSAFGGGFTQLTGRHDALWLVLASIVSPLAMVMAGYNGTIFGLLGITIIFILAAAMKSQTSDESRTLVANAPGMPPR
ncbi:MAG TPA: hypothetical protein VF311_01075 [Terriglobales bacterium]|jgi:hypothetical protein